MKKNPIAVTYWLLACCCNDIRHGPAGCHYPTDRIRSFDYRLGTPLWVPCPFNQDEWQRAFAAYQNIPQYQILNHDMTLDAFKDIYFWGNGCTDCGAV